MPEVRVIRDVNNLSAGTIAMQSSRIARMESICRKTGNPNFAERLMAEVGNILKECQEDPLASDFHYSCALTLYYSLYLNGKSGKAVASNIGEFQAQLRAGKTIYLFRE